MPRYGVTPTRTTGLRAGDLINFYTGDVGRITAVSESGSVLHVRSLYWSESLLLSYVGLWLDRWVIWD